MKGPFIDYLVSIYILTPVFMFISFIDVCGYISNVFMSCDCLFSCEFFYVYPVGSLPV